MKPERETVWRRHLAAGDSWAHDREAMTRRSKAIAWSIAGVATVVALCEAFALMALAPLKSVQPYTLLVDRQTGFVQALKPLDPQLVAADAALTQSFLVQYVIAREGFDINALQSDYRKVALWSAGQARADYLSRMQAGNPDSPLARYPRTTTVDVEVKSVSSIGADASMVRFDTLSRDAGSQTPARQSWVSIIRYTYSKQPMSADDRFLNPLGFKVERYRRNIEVLPQPTVLLPAATAAVTPPPPFEGAYPPRTQPAGTQR